MIFFLVKKYHDYTVGNFLQTWARSLIGKIQIMSYEDCAFCTRLHRGTYVFTDFERLSDPQIALVKSIAPQVVAAGCKVLNFPDRVQDRYQLQTKLHAKGINQFRVFRAEEDLSTVKFPVFVRRISDHMGKTSPVIENANDLVRELAERKARGETNVIIVEKIDVRGADGLFRKYGVFRCGDRLVTRHLYFSPQWLQNIPDLIDDDKVAQEAAYMHENPHLDQVREAFEIAGTEYGRMDYGVVNGKIQVWEINTNPMMMAAPYKIDPRRLPAQARATEKAREAIEAIDDGTAFDENRRENWFDLSIDPDLRIQLGVKRSDEALRWVGKALGRLSKAPGVREIVQTCQRARWLATR